MTFNTGNNVPSTDPRDLYDNAENLDKLVNGADPFYADRKGILRESWAGMENTFATSQTGRETSFTLSQADKESRFQAFLVSSGYVSKGDYAAGVVLAERNEYVAVDATTTGTSPGLYRPNASATLPLTLTGTWATDSASLVLLGDDVLRQELTAGSSMIVAGSATFDLARSIPSVAAMTSVAGRYDGDAVWLAGYHAETPGVGGGAFRWDAASTATPDGGTVLEVPGVATGRWVRQFTGPLMAEFFGARPGLDFDSTSAFQAAATAAGAGGSWRWRGRHRITSTVNIPRRQTFGSYGSATSWSPGGLTNWQGPNAATAQALDNAVFFDPPTQTGQAAFFCEEGAMPVDFTLYSLGFKTIGADVSQAQVDGEHHNVAGISYNKYIKPKNVVVALCRTAFESKAANSEQGNYYTSLNQCEVLRCFQAFSFGSTDPYNTKLYDCKISMCSRLLDCAGGIRNFVMYGGSVEGYRQPSAIRGGGAATFLGTYFETAFSASAVTAVIYVAGNSFTVTTRDCLIYLNHCQRFVLVESGYSGFNLNSSGNTFVNATSVAASCVVFSITNSTSPDGDLHGDKWIQDGGPTATYVDSVQIGFLRYPSGFTISSNVIHARKAEGIALQSLAAAPASPVGGVIYMANGGSWDPLSRTGGFAYPVIWRGAWQALA